MRNLRAFLFAALVLFPAAALGQGIQLPNSIPSGTVLGRLKVGTPGPIQPIPFATLLSQLGLGSSTSIINPGTNTLEMVLPVENPTVSTLTNSYTVLGSDLFRELRLSNAGTNYTVNMPALLTAGMVNGTRLQINNIDSTATATITAGTSTQICTASGCGSTGSQGPARSSLWLLDTTVSPAAWRPTQNGLSSLLASNNLSDLANRSSAATNLFPTPTRPGDMIYWGGSAWVPVAGNNVGSSCLVENSSGVPSFGACGSSLIPVVGSLTIYVSTAGNDSTGNGTIGNPYASCAKAISVAQTGYSLGFNAANTITISFANGTYTPDSSHYCQLNGPLSGQVSPAQLVFTATNTGTLSNVIIEPASSGAQPLGVSTGPYGFGTAFGAMATIQWITFDGRNTANDILNFGGRGSQVHISNVECSLALYPGNCSSIYGATYLQIDGPVTLAGAGLGITCTWGSSASTLTSCTGTSNAVVGQGITAGNGTIPWPCLVATVNTGTNVITINCNTTGTGTAQGATVWYGGNAFLAASQGSQVYANTNGAPATQIPIAINSSPYFNQSTLYADNAQISLQAITWQSNSKPVNQQAISQPWQTRHNGIIDLNGSGFPSVPGSKNAIQTTASVTSGSTTASSLGTVTGVVAGMSINGFVPTTTTFSNSVSSITVGCSSCGIGVGQPVIHPCVAGGTTVSSGGGGSTTVGLSSPTICASGAGDAIYFTGYAIPNGDVLTSVNTGASTAVMGEAANATVNPVNIAIVGSQVSYGGGAVQ